MLRWGSVAMPKMTRLVLMAAAVVLPVCAAAAASPLPVVNPATPPAQPPQGWVQEGARVWLRTDVPNTVAAWRQVDPHQWVLVTQDGG